MKLASIIGISLLGFSSFLVHAIDITRLPTLSVDSISLTNVLDQTVRVSVRGAGCPETAIELKKDETRMLTCLGATSFTLTYSAIDGAGVKKDKVQSIPAGAHYTSGGIDWTDNTGKFVDIRTR